MPNPSPLRSLFFSSSSPPSLSLSLLPSFLPSFYHGGFLLYMGRLSTYLCVVIFFFLKGHAWYWHSREINFEHVFFLDFVKWGSNPKYVQKTSIRMRLFVGKAAIFCTNWLKRNYRYMYVYIWVLLQFLRGPVLQGIHKPYRLAYNSWAKLFSIILYCCELLIMYLLIVYSSFCWILGSKLK